MPAAGFYLSHFGPFAGVRLAFGRDAGRKARAAASRPHGGVGAGVGSRGDVAELRLGARRYELSDWLGSVRVVLTDQRIAIRGNNQVVVGYRAQVVDARDYYSYGLDISERSYGSPIHPYRYSFNGKEDLREQRWYQDYGARFYRVQLLILV
jgi:hypothetical protein